ncbi:hypothetical protein BpHYR1_029212 [Brachionus plicatilis]|uniref:Uncharacterized protein n=1 Tax=Brachionus plicatilis TaxID=10195 RepID=A0A3M7S420_BRAPC|nr:hypothetical protein BpHYR1_029212 [Brachionus plicatilis]
MANKDENLVMIQSNLDIEENDIDLVIMFFESKKQSGGGDTFSSEKIGKRLIKLNFEDNEAQKRVLERKYFSFKKYQFKSFDSEIMGYQNDSYPANKNQLIIKDILMDSDFDSINYDDSVIKMYAEHLSPNNEVTRIQKSNLFENTFFVNYKQDLDGNQVKNRYSKKPKLRNQVITLLDSFNTKSFLITSKSLEVHKFDKIRTKVNEEMARRNGSKNFFMDITDSYVLVQCEDENMLHELKDMMKLSLKSTNYNYVLEEIHNYKLLDLVKCEKSELEHAKQDAQMKMSDNLENVQPQQVPENEIIELDLEQTETATLSRSKLKRKAKAEKITMSPVEEKKDEFLSIEKIKMNEMHLSDLFKSQTESEIVLNEEAPFSIGLLNCSQLRTRLSQLLSKHKADLYFNKKNKFKPLVLKFNKESIKKVVNIVKNYAKTHFIYKIVHLSPEIGSDQVLKDALVNYLPNLNRQFPGLYINLSDKALHCYGYPKSVGKVLNTNYGLLKEIIQKRNLETKEPVQEKIKTEQVEQDFLPKQASKKPKTSRLKSETSDVARTTDENEKNEWKISVRKLKEEKPLYTDENRIILYNSYKRIETIQSIDKQDTTKVNFVPIDPNINKVLSICLKKCEKITLDFIDDLKLVSNDCRLVYVKGEVDPMEQCGIMIDSDEEKYVEAYKTELEKILNFYEKNRLKHVYNLIDEKLKREEIFSTLISNFSSKNELDDLKIILNMIYLDDKVVHAQLTDKKLIEVYGYTNAVQNYDTYSIEILNKTMNHFKNNLKNLLAFKLWQKENPKISIFFRFDGNYFNDFVMQIAAYEAHVVKLDDQKALHIACFNKKLRNSANCLDVVEDTYNWRQSIDSFVFQYLELFGIEQFKVPFTRSSQECQSVLYDKSVLDVSWIDENEVEVVGIQHEIEKLKLKLL